jgi:hypothetical protein
LLESLELDMTDQFKPLDDVAEDQQTVLSFDNSMYKVGEFMGQMKSAFQVTGIPACSQNLQNRGGVPYASSRDANSWLKQGVNCELLKPGSNGWKKGKVRIKMILEFCPDEPEVEEISESQEPKIPQPESPLDDLRQRINQENQPENQ